jgi:hypothetical protein
VNLYKGNEHVSASDSVCSYLGSLVRVTIWNSNNPFSCYTIQGSVAIRPIVIHLLRVSLYKDNEHVSASDSMCPYLGSLASVELMKGDNPFSCHTIQGSVARTAIVSHVHFCLIKQTV